MYQEFIETIEKRIKELDELIRHNIINKNYKTVDYLRATKELNHAFLDKLKGERK